MPPINLRSAGHRYGHARPGFYDFNPEAFDPIFDSLRASVPCSVLDVPQPVVGMDQAPPW